MIKNYYKERLEKQLAQIINETLLFKIKDQRIRNTLVNVTRIKLSNDKTVASIFIRVLDEKEKNKMIKMLYNSRAFFMSAIYKKLSIKNYPQLRFLLDEDVKEEENDVLALIERLKKNND